MYHFDTIVETLFPMFKVSNEQKADLMPARLTYPTHSAPQL
jgi:hypothetical protein